MFWQDDGPNLIVTLTPEEVRSLKIKHGRSKDDSSTTSLKSFDLGNEETKSVSKPKHSLFLSSEMATNSLQHMKELGITHILVPADNAGARHKKHLNYKVIKISDTVNADLLSILSDCIEFIEQGLVEGNVLVHCFAGVSRSASVVIAFLMYLRKMTSKEATSFVKERRKVIDPNLGFLRQLDVFESMNFSLRETPHKYELYLLEREMRRILLGTPSRRVTKTVNGSFFNLCLGVDAEELKNLSSETLKRCQVLINSNPSCLYGCENCGRLLFTELNVRKHKKENCETIYVEIMNWMGSQSSTNGEIKCPKCSQIVGICNWRPISCSCGQNYDNEIRFYSVKKFPFSLILDIQNGKTSNL